MVTGPGDSSGAAPRPGLTRWLLILAGVCFAAAAIVLVTQTPRNPYHVGKAQPNSCKTVLDSPSFSDAEYREKYIAECNQERIRYLGWSVLLLAGGSLAVVGSAATAWRSMYPPRS